MLRTAGSRGGRRALGSVCALLLATGLGFVSAREQRVARAEPVAAPVTPPARAAEPAAPAPPAPPRPWPRSPALLDTPAGKRVVAVPPRARAARSPEDGPAPLRILLHGMCGDAAGICDAWGPTDGRWLACPAGNARCGGADDWKGTGEEKAVSIDAAIDALDRAYGPALLTHEGGDVLVGFSRGAFVARDVVYARPGRFRALVLLGASLSPDAARLRAAGIRRVVMAAGDYDGARPVMQRAARALDAAGLPARYLSLGPIAHALPQDVGAVLREALAWVEEDASLSR